MGKNILNFFFVSSFSFLGLYLKSVLNILKIIEWLKVKHQIFISFLEKEKCFSLSHLK